MSYASKQVTVRFSPKSGTYTTIIQSPSGDLYQEYEGTSSTPTAITPDFATKKPSLLFIATSSRVAEGIAIPTACDWYFNGTKLNFDANNISTNNLDGTTGHFKKLPYSAGTQDYWGLQVQKNLVLAAAGSPCTIRAAASVVYGTDTDSVQATYNIPIRPATGSPYVITIAAGDTKYFTITTNGGSCIIKAMAYQSGAEIASNLTYQWYKMVGNAWTELSGRTAQSLTVSADMVDVYSLFKCVAKQDGTEIGSDVQGVMDASDPYDIIPTPDPADETIRNSGDIVVYTPILVKRGTTTPAMTSSFNFSAFDSVGIVLGTASNASSFTVTYAMCEQAGTDVGVYIESVS